MTLPVRKKSSETEPSAMDISGVLEHLPHRYPFLLVDRVLECVPGERIKALKNVSVNEPFFPGHFPKYPVMPGVLILEALAQASGILTFKTLGRLQQDNEHYYFAAIDSAKFRKPVLPGDQLILNVELIRTRRGLSRFKAWAEVDGVIVCQAELTNARVTTDDE